MTITPPMIGESVASKQMYAILKQSPTVYVPLMPPGKMAQVRVIAKREGRYLLVNRYPLNGKFVTRVELV